MNRPSIVERNVRAPMVRPRAVSGTMMYERGPSFSKSSARSSAISICGAPRTSVRSSGRPVAITDIAPSLRTYSAR